RGRARADSRPQAPYALHAKTGRCFFTDARAASLRPGFVYRGVDGIRARAARDAHAIPAREDAEAKVLGGQSAVGAGRDRRMVRYHAPGTAAVSLGGRRGGAPAGDPR